MKSYAKDLFQLQTELIDTKIDMAALKAIDRVLDRIDGLQKEMDNRFKEVDIRLVSLKEDIVAVKTRLNMNTENQTLVRTRFIDYAFKSGWIAGTAVLTFTLTFLSHHFIF